MDVEEIEEVGDLNPPVRVIKVSLTNDEKFRFLEALELGFDIVLELCDMDGDAILPQEGKIG